MKKLVLLFLLILLVSCAQQDKVASLPDNEFLIIAHRGASAYAPEHSLLSYELAVQMQADYIELDVHRTQDKELVALHDRFIELGNDKQAIADTTFQQLKAIQRKASQRKKIPVTMQTDIDPLRIVSTEEVFSHFKDDVNYYIELKTPSTYPGIEKALLQQLRDNDLLQQGNGFPTVILQSFDGDALKEIHKEEPSIPLIQLYSEKNESMLTKSHLRKVAKYASGIGVDEKIVTKELVDRAHAAGLHVHPFTVNDKDAIRRLIELQVNGIFTDVPDVAVELLKEMNLE
ncbi:glycerophosphodiester phosphodiesterase [Sporosarcina sp. ITBMC105]